MEDQTRTMFDDGFGNMLFPADRKTWIRVLHYYLFGSLDVEAEIDPY